MNIHFRITPSLANTILYFIVEDADLLYYVNELFFTSISEYYKFLKSQTLTF